MSDKMEQLKENLSSLANEKNGLSDERSELMVTCENRSREIDNLQNQIVELKVCVNSLCGCDKRLSMCT